MSDETNLADSPAAAKSLKPSRPVAKSPGPTAPVWSEDNPSLPGLPLPASWLESGRALLDSAGSILAIDEPLSHWFERDAAALIGLSFWDLLRERCDFSAAQFDSFRAGSGVFREMTFSIARAGPDDPPMQCEATSHAGGLFIRLSSVLPDRSALEEGIPDYPCNEFVQRQLFTRLARAEAQLRLLSEQWPGVIFSQRADFSFRYISPRIEDLTGVASAEWQRRPHLFWEAVHEGDVEELKHQIAQAKASREPRTITYRLRDQKNGRIVYVLEHRRANVSPGGLVLGYEGVWLDVTRQTLAERRLSSAAWKETLSVLTMGLAHDFGNVMAGIHALAESFLDQVGPGHDFVDGLNLMKQNSRQASQLVHRIINLHEGQTGECYYHNLNEIVVELGDLIQKIIPRRMQLTVRPWPDPLPVYLDAVELRQVVINLVLNAVDAMGPDGHLVLETHAWSELPALGAHAGTPPRGRAVGLSVRDDGCGITAEHLPRIFEPFFTTKPANKGSGLGLYNARVFADRHHGAISVQSLPPPQGGAIVSLLLPEADFAEDVPASAPVSPGRGPGRPASTSPKAARPMGLQP
jgi:PAS domain S-box-containing protein